MVPLSISNAKGGFFFRKCDSFFKSPILQKKIFQKTILNLKKFQAQDSFFGIYVIFWRFGDLKKRIVLSEKKATFINSFKEVFKLP